MNLCLGNYCSQLQMLWEAAKFSQHPLKITEIYWMFFNFCERAIQSSKMCKLSLQWVHQHSPSQLPTSIIKHFQSTKETPQHSLHLLFWILHVGSCTYGWSMMRRNYWRWIQANQKLNFKVKKLKEMISKAYWQVYIKSSYLIDNIYQHIYVNIVHRGHLKYFHSHKCSKTYFK